MDFTPHEPQVPFVGVNRHFGRVRRAGELRNSLRSDGHPFAFFGSLKRDGSVMPSVHWSI